MERTKLHKLMEDASVTDAALATESGISKRHIQYIKAGGTEPTRPRMIAILFALRKLTRNRRLTVTEVFDFNRTTETRNQIGDGLSDRKQTA